MIFRVDGSEEIGLGHMVRSLALADMLQKDFQCEFAVRSPSRFVKDQINQGPFHLLEFNPDSNGLPSEELLAHVKSSDIVVLDGYQFSGTYLKLVKEKGCRIVCIDDLGGEFLRADVVINHSPGALKQSYRTGPFTRVLTGPQYALLRKEFLSAAGGARDIDEVCAAFICFGGSDPNNLTVRALDAMLEIEEVQDIHIVIGSAYHFAHQLKDKIASVSSKKNVTLYHDIAAKELLDVMLASQLAVVPASSVCMEVICVGMGLILGTYVDNQKTMLAGCTDLDCCYSVGNYNEMSTAELTTHIRNYILSGKWKDHTANQKKIITGDSNTRLLRYLKELVIEDQIVIRIARVEDMITYFNWANDPEVRKNSVQTAEIALDDHKQWFYNKISSLDSELYYFELDNLPMGQVRFDLAGNVFRIGFSIDKNFRKRGLGKIILQKAMKTLLFEYNKPLSLEAIVKPENDSSVKIFQGLDFDRAESVALDGKKYLRFVKEILV